jgi:Ca2+-binding EF-hand superfamily protein
MADASDAVVDIDSVLTTGKDVDLTDTSYQTVYAEPEVPEHIRLFFDMLDRDSNGQLDKQEVMDGAQKVGMSEAETERFFTMLDTNKDGVLSFDEFKVRARGGRARRTSDFLG